MQQHPIDRLSTLGQQEKAIRAERKKIKGQLERGEIGPRGEHYTATLHTRLVIKPIPREEQAQDDTAKYGNLYRRYPEYGDD